MKLPKLHMVTGLFLISQLLWPLLLPAQPFPEDPEKPAAATEESTTPAARKGLDHEAVVSFGSDAVLKEGDSAEAVVAIGGSAKAYGKVREAVVAILGNVEVGGEVRDAAVAILGDVNVQPGARIRGDVVAIGGRVHVAEGAVVEGKTQEITIGGPNLAVPESIKKWFAHCVLKMRPLALQVGWVWIIATVFFLLYLFIALLVPRPVQACVDELHERPATTFLLGLLTKLLVPVVLLVLAMTGVGLLIVPFLVAALLIGAIIGKVAIIEWLGLKLARSFGPGIWQKPLVAFLLGTLILTLLYLTWVIGLIAYTVLSIWGLGAAVTAIFGSLKRETPLRPSGPPPSYPADSAGTPLSSPGAPGSEYSTPQSTLQPPQSGTVALPEVLAHPRAGFWERMGAGFLDVVLVSILGAIVGGPPLGFLVALAYFAGMWTWKGTTVGGIVLGLKVVRLDGTPVTFPVALVRALAATFSIVVLFLGFLWIAWDRDQQAWHDKLAGTVVLRQPRGTPLVCF
jgi:uncharacterized RDD family membrane protein YckC